jgi:hypothetical protein
MGNPGTMNTIHFQNSRIILLTILLGSMFPAYPAWSLDELINPKDWNGRFRFGVSMLENYETNFQWDSRSTLLASEFSGTQAGISRTYEDGFVHVDSLSNDFGLTWNWGFQSASQVQGDRTIAFHQRTFTSPSWSGIKEDSTRGINLTWLNEKRDNGGPVTISFLAALDFLPLDTELNINGTADYTLLQDRYSHDLFDPGLLPIPYNGTSTGPGALLRDSPTRTTTNFPDGAQFNRQMKLDGNLLTLGAGGEIEYAATDELSLLLQIRFLFGWFNGDFDFSDSFNVGGTEYAAETGSLKVSETLAGATIGGGFSWKLNESTDFFATGHGLLMKSISGNLDGRSFELDLRKSLLLNIGIQKDF